MVAVFGIQRWEIVNIAMALVKYDVKTLDK